MPSKAEVREWNEMQVVDFVTSHLGSSFTRAQRSAFVDKGVDGDCFLWLGPEDMEDLEIESKRDQDRLLALVAKVKSQKKSVGASTAGAVYGSHR